MIAQPVHGCLKLREIHILRFLTKKRKYILTPPECAVIGVCTDIVMISCDKDYFCMSQFREEIIHFSQLPDQRLTVEQIPRDQ